MRVPSQNFEHSPVLLERIARMNDRMTHDTAIWKKLHPWAAVPLVTSKWLYTHYIYTPIVSSSCTGYLPTYRSLNPVANLHILPIRRHI